MMTMVSDVNLAHRLAEIGDVGQGTLVSLIARKKGELRGGKVYGDDFVHVVIWSGFHYSALVQRSLRKLDEIWSGGTLFQDLLADVHRAGHTGATVKEISEAVQEVKDSLTRSDLRARAEDPTSGVDLIHLPEEEMEWGGCTKPVFEPLVVAGKTIVGAKVYVGKGDPSNPRAAVPGTIYLDGVKLGEKILEPAPNGYWTPKQAAKAAAKQILRSRLPVGLYVRYSLAKERVLACKIGMDASAHARSAGVPIDPESIRSLFRIAA
jgi:hypothetical protein